jgi:hypothetical protein
MKDPQAAALLLRALFLCLPLACAVESVPPSGGGGGGVGGAPGPGNPEPTNRPDAADTAPSVPSSGPDAVQPPPGLLDAGSSATAPDGGSGAAARTACSEAASAFCGKLRSCSAFALSITYGDLATCQQRFLLGCLAALDAPETSATIADTRTCAQALPAIACADLIAGQYGPLCTPRPGPRLDGAPCGEDAQCASTFCARAPGGHCGTCSPLSSDGGPCANASCSRGLVCPEGAARCFRPVPGKAGDSCTMLEQCDVASGVGCNTLTRTCINLTVASPGGSCGADLGRTSFTLCPASGSCSALLAGRCSAAAADNAPCNDADTGPKCLPPSRCVRGACALPDPASCR